METNEQPQRTTKSAQKLTIKYSGIFRLFEVLNNHRISESQLRLLYLLCGKSSLKNTIVDIHQNEIDVLIIGGWLSGWTGQTENSNQYSLTEKGFAFLQEIDELFLKPKKKILPDIPAEMVTVYNEIFPKIKIPMTGKYARCNESELTKSLQWFIHEYGFDWETILKATTRYVNEREVENWNYLQTSKYYIRKQDSNKVWVSNLADACMAIVNGIGDDESKNHFKEKIV